MSDVLHNMSAPPRSKVSFVQRQLKEYIAFNPLRLARLLNNRLLLFGVDLVEEVNDYVSHHPNINKNIKRPTGYMIGEYIELGNTKKFTKDLSEKMDKYHYRECNDLELLIIVLCSSVGDLYIPNHPLVINDSKFDKILFFPKEEVES